MSGIADILQQRAGLGPDQAQEVEQVIIQFIESKVPSEFQGVVSSVLGAGGQAAGAQSSGGLGGLLGMAEGFLGNK
jgi:hypothetical protein